MALCRVSKMMLTEDATVPISKIPAMVRRINEISQKYQVPIYLLAHAGDGNMHPLIPYDPEIRKNRKGWISGKRIFEASIALGGTLSGEHGIGLAKKSFLYLEVTPGELQVWKNIKKAFDPEGILNPGKFV